MPKTSIIVFNVKNCAEITGYRLLEIATSNSVTLQKTSNSGIGRRFAIAGKNVSKNVKVQNSTKVGNGGVFYET